MSDYWLAKDKSHGYYKIQWTRIQQVTDFKKLTKTTCV